MSDNDGYEPTMNLRWHMSPRYEGAKAKNALLQQEWVHPDSLLREWRVIPQYTEDLPK